MLAAGEVVGLHGLRGIAVEVLRATVGSQVRMIAGILSDLQRLLPIKDVVNDL